MARLNDPAPDPNALDLLKRRFTRQNRDLARTNSAQSLRIRNLETQISQLLAENISLREAAIVSHAQAEAWRTQSGLGAEVLAMKEKLEKKLGEVSELVLELGGLPEKAARRKSREKRQSLNLLKQQVTSPDQKDWRNKQTLGGVLGGSSLNAEQEGRLPPILEDKQYPRRTMEPLEIQELRDIPPGNDSESPEIGPPPISNFDAVDRGSWGDTSESPPSQEATILEPDVMQLPSNLETRRKRRTSSLLSDMTPSESESDAQDSRPALFKSGAKRKLDVSDLEEPQLVAQENDDFVFQRKPALKPIGGRKSGRFSSSRGYPPGDVIIPPTHPSPNKEHTAERKVLAAKSTNSPSKRPASIDTKDHKPNGRDGERRRISVVRNITGITQPSKPLRNQQSEAQPELNLNHDSDGLNDDLPPKTPFTLDDMLSPVSTEPSTKNESRRIPQEAAIINSVEDVLNGSIGRASRRAKAAVSYAEPSLRDKMRRPGKELVSAVEGIDRKGSREASVGAEFRRSQSENPTNGDDSARVKTEEGRSEAESGIDSVPEKERWRKLPIAEVRVKKEEPTSPLSDKKQAEADEDRKHDKRNRTAVDTSASTSVNMERLQKDIGRLSIFDPPSSSPASDPQLQVQTQSQPSTLPPKHGRPARESTVVAHSTTNATSKRRPLSQSQSASSTTASSRAERRHSMAPSTSNIPSHHSTGSLTGSHGSVPAAKSSNASAVQQRPSSAASNRSDGAEGKRHTVELKRAASVAALSSRNGGVVGETVAGTRSGGTGENGNGEDAARARAERIAGRRRSMMI